ncbi:MAG: L-rhamnose mutarotase [Ginsengibacter sp.]
MQENTGSQNVETTHAPVKKRIAFRMQLYKDLEEEYRRRHSAIWPELKMLLKSAGISDYSIFFDKTTNSLIGVMSVEDLTPLDDLPAHPVMKKWWAYMKDIMETNEDDSPVAIPLEEVFYLP